MKAPRKKAAKTPDKKTIFDQAYPHRLTELEVELRGYPSRAQADRALKEIQQPTETQIAQQTVIQFSVGNKSYAAGHSDITYSGANHARGVRRIRFYAQEKAVLVIEGDFEDQQFGSNFRFQNLDLYLPGDWESDFMTLTDALRDRKSDRKAAFTKKRAAHKQA